MLQLGVILLKLIQNKVQAYQPNSWSIKFLTWNPQVIRRICPWFVLDNSLFLTHRLQSKTNLSISKHLHTSSRLLVHVVSTSYQTKLDFIFQLLSFNELWKKKTVEKSGLMVNYFVYDVNIFLYYPFFCIYF